MASYPLEYYFVLHIWSVKELYFAEFADWVTLEHYYVNLSYEAHKDQLYLFAFEKNLSAMHWVAYFNKKVYIFLINSTIGSLGFTARTCHDHASLWAQRAESNDPYTQEFKFENNNVEIN